MRLPKIRRVGARIGLTLLCVVLSILCACTRGNAVHGPESVIPAVSADTDSPFPPFLIQQIDALPYAAKGAVAYVSAVGGNPTFYLFDKNTMTYYIRDVSITDGSETVYEGTLTVPEGYTNARIFYLTPGAGSGEVYLYAGANKDGSLTFFCYYVYCDDVTQVYPSMMDDSGQGGKETLTLLTEKWSAMAP